MRAFTAGWTGRRLNESNMTLSGEYYANQILDLFNRADTLSEFNSGTYTGVSLWALSLWAKYLPEDSVMKQNGARMMKKTWEAVGELWHPDLKNIAGPWDRSYGFDMNRYLSLMALHFWNIVGKENSSLIEKVSFTLSSESQPLIMDTRSLPSPTLPILLTAHSSPSWPSSRTPSSLRMWLRNSPTLVASTLLPRPLSRLLSISTHVTSPLG